MLALWLANQDEGRVRLIYALESALCFLVFGHLAAYIVADLKVLRARHQAHAASLPPSVISGRTARFTVLKRAVRNALAAATALGLLAASFHHRYNGEQLSGWLDVMEVQLAKGAVAPVSLQLGAWLALAFKHQQRSGSSNPDDVDRSSTSSAGTCRSFCSSLVNSFLPLRHTSRADLILSMTKLGLLVALIIARRDAESTHERCQDLVQMQLASNAFELVAAMAYLGFMHWQHIPAQGINEQPAQADQPICMTLPTLSATVQTVAQLLLALAVLCPLAAFIVIRCAPEVDLPCTHGYDLIESQLVRLALRLPAFAVLHRDQPDERVAAMAAPYRVPTRINRGFVDSNSI